MAPSDDLTAQSTNLNPDMNLSNEKRSHHHTSKYNQHQKLDKSKANSSDRDLAQSLNLDLSWQVEDERHMWINFEEK